MGLSFGGVPERLVVPFEAITAFYDPAVQFGFQFETVEAEATGETKAAEDANATAKAPERPFPVPRSGRPPTRETPYRLPPPVFRIGRSPGRMPAAAAAKS